MVTYGTTFEDNDENNTIRFYYVMKETKEFHGIRNEQEYDLLSADTGDQGFKSAMGILRQFANGFTFNGEVNIL